MPINEWEKTSSWYVHLTLSEKRKMNVYIDKYADYIETQRHYFDMLAELRMVKRSLTRKGAVWYGKYSKRRALLVKSAKKRLYWCQKRKAKKAMIKAIQQQVCLPIKQ